MAGTHPLTLRVYRERSTIKTVFDGHQYTWHTILILLPFLMYFVVFIAPRQGTSRQMHQTVVTPIASTLGIKIYDDANECPRTVGLINDVKGGLVLRDEITYVCGEGLRCCGVRRDSWGHNNLASADNRGIFIERIKKGVQLFQCFFSRILVNEKNDFSSRFFFEGWGLPVVNEEHISADVFSGLRREWNYLSGPHVGTLVLRKINPPHFEGLLGEIVRPSGFANIGEQSQERKNFKDRLPPLKAILAFLFGFLFFGWGWCWWKGLYYNPDGAAGYILASIACIIGIILWCCGMLWSAVL
jgi:hypothetical protein